MTDNTTSYCRNCAAALQPNAAICIHCGVLRGNGTTFCWNCAGALAESAAFCMSCGAARTGIRSSSHVGSVLLATAKSKTTAGILGIFLGGLGIHRFYLGYTTIGIIQAVLTICTFGIAALWGFVEGILILAGEIKADATGQPLGD